MLKQAPQKEILHWKPIIFDILSWEKYFFFLYISSGLY